MFGNARFQPGFDAAFYKAMGEPAKLAPNLRFARERLTRATFVRFVQDPQAVDPSVSMPKMGVTPAEAEQLADFVFGAEPELAPPPAEAAAVPDIPVLARTVPFDEVFDEVLGKICVHCHMDPATNAGDGGAGNTGGLGYVGKRLSLESYPSVARGLLREGKRVSIVQARAPMARRPCCWSHSCAATARPAAISSARSPTTRATGANVDPPRRACRWACLR